MKILRFKEAAARSTLLAILAGLIVLAPGCGQSRVGGEVAPSSEVALNRPVTGVLFKSVHLDGREHRYALYVPRAYEQLRASGPLPLVVFLNGRGECGTDGSRQALVGLCPALLSNPDRWPCVVVMPQKPGEDETWAAWSELVMACVAEAEREWTIDPRRVYLTGLSQGGAGTWALAAQVPMKWAAIAPVCGFVHAPGGKGTVKFGDVDQRARIAEAIAAARIPVWAFHGGRDDIIPVEQSATLIDAIKARGGEARLTVFPDANHNAWDPAYRDPGLPQWLFAQQRMQ